MLVSHPRGAPVRYHLGRPVEVAPDAVPGEHLADVAAVLVRDGLITTTTTTNNNDNNNMCYYHYC